MYDAEAALVEHEHPGNAARVGEDPGGSGPEQDGQACGVERALHLHTGGVAAGVDDPPGRARLCGRRHRQVLQWC